MPCLSKGKKCLQAGAAAFLGVISYGKRFIHQSVLTVPFLMIHSWAWLLDDREKVFLPCGSNRREPQGRKEGSVRVLAFASFCSVRRVFQSCVPTRVGADANVSRRDLALRLFVVMMCVLKRRVVVVCLAASCYLRCCVAAVRGWSAVLLYRGRPVEDGGGRPHFSISRPPLPDRNFGQG